MGAVGALCVAFLLVNIVAVHASNTTFTVQNLAPTTPGGMLYTTKLGDSWTLMMLYQVRLHILEELWPSYRPAPTITLIIDNTTTGSYSSENEIHVGTAYLANITGDLKLKFREIMLEDVCFSFQNNLGNYGTDPHFTGVIQGIASYMALTAGYGKGAKAQGGNWYDGGFTTAYFFAWIDETEVKHFVKRLNRRMGHVEWNDDNFRRLTNKTVDALWALYQKSFSEVSEKGRGGYN